MLNVELKIVYFKQIKCFTAGYTSHVYFQLIKNTNKNIQKAAEQ